jgi:hypothetical protein
MSGKRQKTPEQLALRFAGSSEAATGEGGGTETSRWNERPKTRLETFISRRSLAQPIEPPYTRPVRTVVWEGRRSDPPPYPDLESVRHKDFSGHRGDCVRNAG